MISGILTIIAKTRGGGPGQGLRELKHVRWQVECVVQHSAKQLLAQCKGLNLQSHLHAFSQTDPWNAGDDRSSTQLRWRTQERRSGTLMLLNDGCSSSVSRSAQ